jgi:two-component system response regulator PilR (NtrC family)
MPEGRILVIDDEEIVQDVLLMLLAKRGYDATGARSGEEGLEKLARGPFDVVLLDLMLPGIDGMETLRRIREDSPEQTVVMMTAFGSVETAVEAMKIGAFHYLTKPFKNDEVLLLIGKAIERRRLVDENRRLKLALSQRYRYGRLIGKSHLMQSVFSMVEQVAPSRSTVLIQGESGTGKELIAHAVHSRSPRADAPFVVVNSNSIPPDLLESNLFGHMRGSFTGATHDKKGLFEAANGGSIFFDEISTVRSEVQAKLLRVMQEKEFIPLGSTHTVTVDVRIIAATNVDLRDLVERNEFREDLYYRLNVISVKLPPLRDRPEDIPLLLADFLDKYNAENNKAVEGFTPGAVERMLRHRWPGNVRELENLVERAVVLAKGTTIEESQLPSEISGSGPVSFPPGTIPEIGEGFNYYDAIDRYERELIAATLAKCRGVQKRAAEMLGLKATTLNEKIKRLGIGVRS